MAYLDMKHLIRTSAWIVSGLLIAACNAFAASDVAAVPSAAASKPATVAKPGKISALKAKQLDPSKLIDINSASIKELKTLNGIGDVEAKKIIAGRPYGSKVWLVTDKILNEATYQAIRHQIIAKQPYKDGAKNAALYKNRAANKAPAQ